MPDLPSLLAETAYKAVIRKLRRDVLSSPLPSHVAVIMDGNRRWAREVGHDVEKGYERGLQNLMNLVEWCYDLGIPYLTVFALSTENLKRSREELNMLFGLMKRGIRMFEERRPWERGIAVRVIGKLRFLPDDVRREIERILRKRPEEVKLTVTVALAYGGRLEIIEAIRRIAEDVRRGLVKPEEIDEDLFRKYLMTSDIPDPDLILRTSGEERISNFLIWQAAYSEFVFTDVYWPNFSELDFLRAIRAYQLRERRFGR